MPYQIESHCPACNHSSQFTIGDWTRHLGVYVCSTCKAFVNIPVEDGQCPGCNYQPQPADLYDYALAIPYLGGQAPFALQPGPLCPQCRQQSVTFENNAHLNLGSVVYNEEGAKATWGKDYMEKAIFMNSTIPVIQEFQLDPKKVFAYFHLHIPAAPLITRCWSYPIALDIRTHLMIRINVAPQDFRSDVPPLQS